MFKCLRINFRLTQEEHARFAPLMRELKCDNWSELCRLALRRTAIALADRASDNGVRQEMSSKPTAKVRTNGTATKPKSKGTRPHKLQES